jgi:hypothetical protein
MPACRKRQVSKDLLVNPAVVQPRPAQDARSGA